MKTVIRVALGTLLACGGLLLVLGLIIWIGDRDQLISGHVTLGVVFVLTLWTIAAIAMRSGVPTATVALGGAWGVLTLVLGLMQESLVTGSFHWMIQILHVAVSMGAIWWGRRLVKLIAQARSQDRPSLSRPPMTPSIPRVK